MLQILLATTSPVIRGYFADLAHGAARPISVTYIDLDDKAVDFTAAAVTSASVAVVDTGNSAELTGATGLCGVLREQREDLPILVLVYTPRGITPWHVEALLSGDLRGLLDLRSSEEQTVLALESISHGCLAIHVGVDQEHWANLREALGHGRMTGLAAPRPTRGKSTSHRIGDLTKREREVLAVLAQGATDKEVAARLGVSLSTVESHVHGIMGRLGVRTRVQLGIEAARLALMGGDA